MKKVCIALCLAVVILGGSLSLFLSQSRRESLEETLVRVERRLVLLEDRLNRQNQRQRALGVALREGDRRDVDRLARLSRLEGTIDSHGAAANESNSPSLAELAAEVEDITTVLEETLDVVDELSEKRASDNIAKHNAAKDAAMREAVANYRRAVVGVEESAFVYSSSFPYPDRDGWEKIDDAEGHE